MPMFCAAAMPRFLAQGDALHASGVAMAACGLEKVHQNDISVCRAMLPARAAGALHRAYVTTMAKTLYSDMWMQQLDSGWQ